jgi:hypothetical protein
MGPIGPTRFESIMFLVFAACFFMVCGAIAWNCFEFVSSHLSIRWAW